MVITLIEFVDLILHLAIQALIWLIFASVAVSWLVAFDVINMRNRLAYQVVHFLNAVTRPILRPIQRIMPPLGGIDISPAIVMILLIATDQVLLPRLMAAIAGSVSQT